MEKIKCVVIDDVQAIRQFNKNLIRDYHSETFEVVGEAYDVASAIEEIDRLNPQLVFMDIKFEYTDGRTGFDILDHYGKETVTNVSGEIETKYKEIPFEVIFITDFQEYAVKAFEVAAVGYVLKPLKSDDLDKYISRAKERIRNNAFGKSSIQLVINKDIADKNIADTDIILDSQEQKIGINCVNSNLQFISISDITHISAENGLVKIFRLAGRALTTDRPVKRFAEILERFGFFKIHNAHLVNCHHLVNYDGQTVRLTNMPIGENLPVSTRNRPDFRLYLERIRIII